VLPGFGQVQSCRRPSFAVVGVNNGKINGFNACFARSGLVRPNLSVYIIWSRPGRDPAAEATGEASCSRTSSLCEGYDWVTTTPRTISPL